MTRFLTAFPLLLSLLLTLPACSLRPRSVRVVLEGDSLILEPTETSSLPAPDPDPGLGVIRSGIRSAPSTSTDIPAWGMRGERSCWGDGSMLTNRSHRKRVTVLLGGREWRMTPVTGEYIPWSLADARTPDPGEE